MTDFTDVNTENLQVKYRPVVDARAYGTFGTQSAITSALTAIGSNERTLLIANDFGQNGSGQWDIATNLTIPPNVNLRFENGAYLRVTSGAVVQIEGKLDAPPTRIFDMAAGTVRFDDPTDAAKRANINEVYAEWWGAKGDGTTDDRNAIQAALDAASEGVNAARRRAVVLLSKVYKVGTPLTFGCDVRGEASPTTGAGATLIYTGAATTACLKNYNNPYNSSGIIIRNIRIDMRNNTNNDVYGILFEEGHTYGVFENVQILCNPAVKHHGIRIKATQPPPPNPPQFNAARNQFINLDIEDPDIGLWIGDDSNPGQGKFNFIAGGIILNAKKAAILLTGEENAIIGGDFSAATTGNVFLFSGGLDSQGAEITGGWCRNNSIVGTGMEIIGGTSSHYAIKINAISGINQVFNATSMRVAGLANFVTDNDTTRQRWVAVRSNGAVEAREFFARGINALGNGDPFNVSLSGALSGETADKAFAIRASTDSTPGMILLGASNVPTLWNAGLPVWRNGVTLLIGGADTNPVNNGIIYFAKLTSDSQAQEIAKMDSTGNLTLKGAFTMSGSDGRVWQEGSFNPTTSPGTQGDIVWKNNPTAGGKIGWVCIATGNPGTWKEFGLIDS